MTDTKSEKAQDTTPSSSATVSGKDDLKPEVELLSALGSLYPKRTLPTSLAVGYLSTPDLGLVLKLSMQLERGAFDFEPDSESQQLIG